MMVRMNSNLAVAWLARELRSSKSFVSSRLSLGNDAAAMTTS
jgi:hypothetical protein